MNNITKPKIETLDAALGEYLKNKKVESIRCERCNDLIEITRVGYAGFIIKCKCGLYNDNLRGL